MTYDDCQTLIGFLRSGFPNLTEDQLDLYAEMLVSENAQDASTAILEGIAFWKFPPTWAEIKEAIRAVRARRPAPKAKEVVYPQDSEIPGWVRRWLYARFVANPPDLRVFREQAGIAEGGMSPKEGWMPDEAWVEEAKTVTPQQVRSLMKAHLEIG